MEAWEILRGVLVAPGALVESSWSHLGTLLGANGSHLGARVGSLVGILFETPFRPRPFVAWVPCEGPFWDRFFKGLGVHARTSRQKVQHAKTYKNH